MASKNVTPLEVGMVKDVKESFKRKHVTRLSLKMEKLKVRRVLKYGADSSDDDT